MMTATPNQTDFIESLAVAKERLDALTPNQAFALGEVIGTYRNNKAVPKETLETVRLLWKAADTA